MSLQALSWAFEQDLPCTQKFVLVALGDAASPTGECFPSQRRLAERCGLSRQSVNKALSDLEASGHIRIVPRERPDGSDTSCTYRLMIPEEETDQAAQTVEPNGWVYVVRSGGRVKVGISRDVERRLKGFQTAFPEGVELVETFPMPMRQARVVERDVLHVFEERRIRGEWIDAPAEEVVAAVRYVFEGVKKRDTGCQGARHPLSSSATPPVKQRDTKNPQVKPKGNQPLPADADPKAYPDEFEAAWKAYPHVKGRSSKVKAHDFWRKLGASRRAGFAAAAERYAKEGREPRMDCGAPAMERWIRDEKFADWLDAPKPATVTELDPWPHRLRELHRNAYWNTTDWGPKPGKPGCRVPAEYLTAA